MTTYRVRSKLVEALQWQGNVEEMQSFATPKERYPCTDEGLPVEEPIGVVATGKGYLVVFTSRGRMTACHGDWVVKRPNGDLSVVKESAFASSFEPNTRTAELDGRAAWKIAKESLDKHREGDGVSAQDFKPSDWIIAAIKRAYEIGAGG